MISAIIITLNEEDCIGQALQSLRGLADEVIVVDSNSSDETLKIAKKYDARIFSRKFDNFANQKNWAIAKVKGEWVLSLDADEEISRELSAEIKDAVKNKSYDGYLIPRKNFILGKEIKYSRWSPDTHIWLWKKKAGKWIGEVHEEVKVEGKVGLLKNSKIHYSHKTIKDFINANNLYSTLEAKSLFEKGVKFSFWKMFWDCFFEFSIRFIYKLGFLDDVTGFTLAFLMGIYKLTVWIKIWELEQK